MKNQQSEPFDLHIIGKILFAVYLVVLVYLMFFSESLGRNDVSEEYHYNLVLFREIQRCLEHWDVLGPLNAAANLGGNVIAFLPFGMFLPYVWKPGKLAILTILLGFLTSLCIEALQLVSRRGSFDVDDLLLNTIGVILGILVYEITKRIHRHAKKQAGDSKIE